MGKGSNDGRSAGGALAGTTEVGSAPDDATAAGAGVVAGAGSDKGASRELTSGRMGGAAELDAGSGAEEAGITTAGADPLDAAGSTALESAPKIPKGSADADADAGGAEEVA